MLVKITDGNYHKKDIKMNQYMNLNNFLIIKLFYSFFSIIEYCACNLFLIFDGISCFYVVQNMYY